MTGAYKQTVSHGLKPRASWFDSNALHSLTPGGSNKGSCDLCDYKLRMWESLAIRRLGVPESVGSNPTILTVIVP